MHSKHLSFDTTLVVFRATLLFGMTNCGGVLLYREIYSVSDWNWPFFQGLPVWMLGLPIGSGLVTVARPFQWTDLGNMTFF